MRNIRFDGYLGPKLPEEAQKKRMRLVIENELSPCQREALVAYYFQHKKVSQIARERGVKMSTVCHTLTRAEKKLQRLLKY